MNTDASYQMIDDEQYTNANNIRIMSTTQGSADKTNSYGEVRPIEGVDVVNTIPDKVTSILATGYIRNLGVVIYSTFESSASIGGGIKIHTFWKVYVYNMTTNEGEVKFSTRAEGYKIPDKFSITLRYEDEDNVKLYIADGIHSIMVLNIAEETDPNLTIDKIQSYPSICF